ncbi:MAG: DNA-processing protein DprA [Polyangia bacterium]|jgi:DNA processing protein
MEQQALCWEALSVAASTPISPWRELGAYESLWLRDGASFAKLARLFREHAQALPSDLVAVDQAEDTARKALAILRAAGIGRFGVRMNRTAEYPEKLRHAVNPVELLYYQGYWPLVETRSVAVVGTRHPSADSLCRTRSIVRRLVKDGFTIVSGLAAGVDTAAHMAAIEQGGQTVAVIGTSLAGCYPPQNRALQARLAAEYLLVSQVPIVRYSVQHAPQNRLFFPERNATMSALTEATIIVEAGETSGTLVQARAALQQGRKLLILDNCFQDPSLTWPLRLAKKGALRVRSYGDIVKALG